MNGLRVGAGISAFGLATALLFSATSAAAPLPKLVGVPNSAAIAGPVVASGTAPAGSQTVLMVEPSQVQPASMETVAVSQADGANWSLRIPSDSALIRSRSYRGVVNF
jgi:hypothetical protein